MSIRIGIMGYGNLGRGVECAIKHNPDMELVAVFTRRDPDTVNILTETAKVYHADEAENMKDEIDVMILCGGSATDLPKQTPKYAQWFNVVDSFDTHAKIPEHFADVDKAASVNNHVGIISVGWDPGMFSLNRMYANAILTNGKDYTFWGKGVSQGHSDAIRRIDGVKDGKQYTIPVEAALEAVRNGENPELTTRQKHTRECFVVAEEGADLARIERHGSEADALHPRPRVDSGGPVRAVYGVCGGEIVRGDRFTGVRFDFRKREFYLVQQEEFWRYKIKILINTKKVGLKSCCRLIFL